MLKNLTKHRLDLLLIIMVAHWDKGAPPTGEPICPNNSSGWAQRREGVEATPRAGWILRLQMTYFCL